MKLTGAEIVIKVLQEQGVDTVFGYPGGAALNIYDELYKHKKDVTHYITAHEQGATHAADGYARASNKTGVAIVTSGPGSTNAITGIATAYMDSIPMVVISANVGSSFIGKDAFQEVYMEGLTLPITKHSFFVSDVNLLADTLREAFKIANEGRKGPVSIDIAKDVTANFCEYEPKEKLESKKNFNNYTKEELERAAEIINDAKKPVVFAGGGVVTSAAYQILRDFVEKIDAPVSNSIMAMGVVDANDSRRMGMLGMHGNVSSGLAVKNADVLIAIGTRFSDRVATDTKNFAKNAKIIHIDIDESEINKNVKVDIGIVGDLKEILKDLLPMLKSKKQDEWLSQIEKWKKEEDYKFVDSKEKLNPKVVIETIEEFLDEKGIITTDVGQHQMWACQFNKRSYPNLFLTSGGLGTMGFGYGAAIGASFANPNAKVVHITGDGSFHMNLNELCTSVSYELPIVTVIMNNNVLGMVRQWQTSFYERRYSYTSTNRKTDFVKVAEGFGAKGYYVKTLDEFKKALKNAFAETKIPTVINCEIHEDLYVLPMIPAGKTIDDVIISGV